MTPKTRKDKLVALKQFLDLETNELIQHVESNLYGKVLHKTGIDRKIKKCRRCPDSNIKSFTDSVPGWGNLDAKVFFIGESPCVHSMQAQFPFAWKSGDILNIILALSGLTRYDVFISNSVHCHPKRKEAPKEKQILHCSEFLYKELLLVRPILVVTLGNSAKAAMQHLIPMYKIYKDGEPPKTIHKTHPAKFLYSNTGLGDYIIKFSLDIDKVVIC